MKAFHDNKEIKKTYLNRVLAHQKADEIIKGQYWSNGKGCAVGCTIHGSDHSKYETELGIPQWIARLEDKIFEGLPNARAKTWPVEFLKAINVGTDLSKCLIPMLIFIVESARKNTKNKKSVAAIDGVLVELKKDVIDYPALRRARAAAYAAADADAAAYATYATYDAAYAAYAAYAAAYYDAAYYAAAYAADAAYAAAYYDAAYYDAAYDAAYARSDEYVKFADKLLELMRGCK